MTRFKPSLEVREVRNSSKKSGSEGERVFKHKSSTGSKGIRFGVRGGNNRSRTVVMTGDLPRED